MPLVGLVIQIDLDCVVRGQKGHTVPLNLSGRVSPMRDGSREPARANASDHETDVKIIIMKMAADADSCG